MITINNGFNKGELVVLCGGRRCGKSIINKAINSSISNKIPEEHQRYYITGYMEEYNKDCFAEDK